MSARAPRRSFATPFVVTLAASIPTAACYVQTRPASSGPTGTTTAQPTTHDHRGEAGPHDHRGGQPAHTNPPRPTGPQVPPPTGTPANAGVEAAPPPPVVTVANPPPPSSQPAPTPRAPVHSTGNAGVQPAPRAPTTAPSPPVHSTTNAGVEASAPATTTTRWSVVNSKGTCRAFLDSQCPTAPKGQTQLPCNPPPPRPYTCPTTLADGQSLKIVLHAGQTTCFVDHGPMSCPKGAICNPPPPQKVACPK